MGIYNVAKKKSKRIGKICQECKEEIPYKASSGTVPFDRKKLKEEKK